MGCHIIRVYEFKTIGDVFKRRSPFSFEALIPGFSIIEMFYLNTIEQLFLFVEQLDQLESVYLIVDF